MSLFYFLEIIGYFLKIVKTIEDKAFQGLFYCNKFGAMMLIFNELNLLLQDSFSRLNELFFMFLGNS